MDFRLIYELLSNNVSNKQQILIVIGFCWIFILIYKNIYTRLEKQYDNISNFINQQISELYTPLDSLFLETFNGTKDVLNDITVLLRSKKYLALDKDRGNIDNYLISPQNDKNLIVLGDSIRNSYEHLLNTQKELGQSFRTISKEIKPAIQSFIIVFNLTFHSLVLTLVYCYFTVSIMALFLPGVSFKDKIISIIAIIVLLILSVALPKFENMIDSLMEKKINKRFVGRIKRFGI